MLTNTAELPKQLRENHISVANLEDFNDDDFSSSIVESDSDLDSLSVGGIRKQAAANGINTGKSNILSNGMIVINKGAATPADLVSGANGTAMSVNNSQRPHIGSIAVQNSTDITIGDKTFYHGPVTVKQFFLENDQWRRGVDGQPFATSEGLVNAGFGPGRGDVFVAEASNGDDVDKGKFC